MGAAAVAAEEPQVKVYWPPGYSSCLKTREFLPEHGVPFQSKNVLEDPEVFLDRVEEGKPDTYQALQADLDAWLHNYNTERPRLGYRNMGRRPIDTVRSFVSQEG